MKPAVADPGLGLERTRLAWRRTTLAATVIALIAGDRALAHGAAGLLALAAVALLWLAVLAVAHRRIRALAHGPFRTAGRSPAALVLLLLGYSTLCALLVWR